MPNVKGLDLLLLVGVSATAPATWSALEGQTSTTFAGSVDMADTTAKGTGAWSTAIATTRSSTVTVSGNLMDSASAPNFALLKTAWTTGATHHCKIVYDAAGNGWSADFYVSIDSLTGDVRDVVKYTMTLNPAGELVVLTPT